MTYDQYKKIIEPTNFDSMFKAIQEKAKHDETYKKNIMELARKGIMPAEISQYDAFWGCGINGNGSNHLGILTHILGRQLLKEAGIKPEKELLDNGVDIDNLKEARQNLSKSYSQFISDKANQHTLSHDVAVKNVDQPIFSYSQKDIQNKKEADQSIREIVNEKLHTESNISTKGRLGETYKFAFKSEKEAQAMLDKLSELGIKTDETSCRALQGGEKYPMGDHKFIVRIEKHVEKNLGILLKNGFNLDDTTSNKLVENAYNNAPPAKSTHATFPPEHFNSSGNIKSTDASYHSGRPTPFPKLL
jgi:hypothetical protein